jgi:hypothetical protein
MPILLTTYVLGDALLTEQYAAKNQCLQEK